MKNEAKIFEKLNKEIKNEKRARNLCIIGGVILLISGLVLCTYDFSGWILSMIPTILIAFGITFSVVPPILIGLDIPSHKHCMEMLKEIFALFPIDEEKTINISANMNVPEEFDLEGKLLSTLSRNVKAKVNLYYPIKEDTIGIRVEIEGYEYFKHTVNIFSEDEISKLRNFLIEE